MKFNSVQETIRKNIVKPSLLYAQKNLLDKWSGKGPREKEVLFVSGVHRSGTNLMMNFLDQGWSCDVFHESDSRAFEQFIMRDRRVIADLARKSAGRLVVFKALHEADELAHLIHAFQPAKAIWMYRDYNDVVNSLTTRWKGNRNSYDKIVKSTDEADWRCRGISDETLDRIRRGYHADDNNATANAWFWFWRNMIFFDLKLNERDDVLLVKYEDFVTRSEKTGAVIADFLNIRLNDSMIRLPHASSIKKSPQQAISAACREACDEMQARLDEAWGRVNRQQGASVALGGA